MIYRDEKGEAFFGPAREIVAGKTYMVEISSKMPEDGHYEIIKFMSQ